MFRKKIYALLFVAQVGLMASFLVNCSEKDNGDKIDAAVASCEGCHTNYAHLQEVYSPDTNVVSGGCGGDVPHYEPYDRVYMGGEGFERFKASGHYNIGCTGCHGGKDSTSFKETAHSGDFIAHPSQNYSQTCGTCHFSTSNNFKTSLHQGTGQKRKVAMRSGFAGPDDFSKLPAHQIEGYNNNCATCHGSCGNCHVVRPPVGGGGLVSGHDFVGNPDMVNTCVTCHVSRGGHAYLGVAPGTKPDVHLTKAGFECIDCHTGSELHGDGKKVDHRYAYDKLPACDDCHTGIQTSNNYHEAHMGDFNCQVCHSQDYNNCGSCHIHGDGARITSYQGFKIALNPIPDDKPGYKYALVRRAPSAPDSWKEYGVDQLADFDVFPTYNYTSPHNIQLWTSRTETEAGADCFTGCHIRNEGGEFINKNLYLFIENLESWEVNATSAITVDNEIPSGWMK